MFTQIGKLLLLGATVFATVLVSDAYADNSTSSPTPPSSNSPSPQTQEQIAKSLSQLRSIQQLQDVNPSNWSYEALKNLVEGYGCIVGYPDRTFRGDRALTRYEFAAGLNACIEALERRIVEAQATTKPSDDLTPIAEIRPVPYEDSYEQFAEMFNRAFFNRTGPFWDIYQSFWGQANTYLGWRNFPGSFLENDIARDAKTMSIILQNGYQQQTPLPRLRTLDLPNPYNTSVRLNPSYLSNFPANPSGVDIIIEPPRRGYP
ncbi:iron uptake porin [Gloeothece verrucosa]|uniref:S-layer domain protein n=1 Tax=Gloeothece verrucosa (strain PCC 7822) TaxID=497965 RepID=E0UHA6_GLOV7|nr:iron uptake porin [Gloeothece verrucosa]ADN16820.1 S-layer domain protein [Gloeothece verrucosa PCC 7822]